MFSNGHLKLSIVRWEIKVNKEKERIDIEKWKQFNIRWKKGKLKKERARERERELRQSQ